MARPDASAKLQATQPKQGPSKVLIAAIIAVVLVIVGGVAWLRTDPFGGLEATGPTGSIAEGGGLEVYPGKAKPGAPEVHVYEDFQCPYCAELERNNGQSMSQLAASGDIKLVIHTMSFLDENLGNDSSARAANAGFCAADAGRFPAFHRAVFAAQPQREGSGYSDATLQAAASSAGITGAARTTFNACLSEGTYRDYVKDTQKRANDDGVNGTPQVQINAKDLDQAQMQQLLTRPNSFPAVLAQVK